MTGPRPRAGSPTEQSQGAFSPFFQKWHSFCSWRASAEKQRTELRQIAAPDHPGVRAGRLDVRVLDIFGCEPGAELTIDIDQSVFRSTSNPKQMKLLRGLGVHRGEFYVKCFSDASGTESADPGKFVQRIQTRQQGFRATHREARDGAGVAALDHEIFGFHERDDFRQQRFAEFIEVALRDYAVAPHS